MGDLFYSLVKFLGTSAFITSARTTILHVERSQRLGAYILAANHASPYDVPLLIRHTRRRLDFVSIVEVFKHPAVAWFYGSMNAFPIDRSKVDRRGTVKIIQRLRLGRAIAIFPEGHLRRDEDSVINGGNIKSGTAKLALLGNAPVIPCVVLNSAAYNNKTAWLPLRRVRYGLNYGEPILIPTDVDKDAAAAIIEEKLKRAFVELHRELLDEMNRRGKNVFTTNDFGESRQSHS